MARVSKKVSAAQREAENASHRIWKTAIYARLSDFDDVLRDTESLEVQISYIKEYINHRDDLMLLDVFADKRCTGMNFDRPEFERLLKALQERKIDCIVVKDFSRLGRNFVETGQYLEQVFPLFGVRFIAINDNYDSLNSQSQDGMLVPIKSMINEMYSKDLSQKIQSCFRSKEARGEIYTPVPFGYKKDQKNHLILDEEVSDVVVRIFLWKKSGMKEREIAKKLSAQGIQTPFTRRCQLGYLKNTLRVKDPAWQPAFVTKVLENPVYTGTMVYNRIAYDETNRKIGQYLVIEIRYTDRKEQFGRKNPVGRIIHHQSEIIISFFVLPIDHRLGHTCSILFIALPQIYPGGQSLHSVLIHPLETVSQEIVQSQSFGRKAGREFDIHGVFNQ